MHVPVFLGAEEHGSVGNLFGRTVATHRDEIIVCRVGRSIMRKFFHLRLNGTRCNVVHIDVVGAELPRRTAYMIVRVAYYRSYLFVNPQRSVMN